MKLRLNEINEKTRPITSLYLLNFTREEIVKGLRAIRPDFVMNKYFRYLHFPKLRVKEVKYNQIVSFFVVFTVSLML